MSELRPTERQHDAGQFELATGPADRGGAGDSPNGRANKPRTLDETLAEVTAAESGLNRDRFPASQLRVEPGHVIAGEMEFRLGAEGLRRLCRRFQAPADYLRRLNPELRSRVLEHHFAQGRYADRNLTDRTTCIISRDGNFLDLGRSDLLTLSNGAVLQSVREGVGTDAASLEVQGLRLDDESFAVDVVSPSVAEEVRPGDIIRAGVQVSHSPLGGQATQVMAYVHRLLCANGLVQRQCLGAKRGSTPRARRLSAERPESREMQMAQIRKLVADTWGGLQEKLTAIRGLRDKRVEVRAALERFLRQAHLYSVSLMARLLEAWKEEGGEGTAFGALNALTRVATHTLDMPTWQRQRLSRLAGVYANQDVHLCPHCFSILAGS
jgi:hypothetical protein